MLPPTLPGPISSSTEATALPKLSHNELKDIFGWGVNFGEIDANDFDLNVTIDEHNE